MESLGGSSRGHDIDDSRTDVKRSLYEAIRQSDSGVAGLQDVIDISEFSRRTVQKRLKELTNDPGNDIQSGQISNGNVTVYWYETQEEKPKVAPDGGLYAKAEETGDYTLGLTKKAEAYLVEGRFGISPRTLREVKWANRAAILRYAAGLMAIVLMLSGVVWGDYVSARVSEHGTVDPIFLVVFALFATAYFIAIAYLGLRIALLIGLFGPRETISDPTDPRYHLVDGSDGGAVAITLVEKLNLPVRNATEARCIRFASFLPLSALVGFAFWLTANILALPFVPIGAEIPHGLRLANGLSVLWVVVFSALSIAAYGALRLGWFRRGPFTRVKSIFQQSGREP